MHVCENRDVMSICAQVRGVSLQSDIANHWNGMHNTVFYLFSQIRVNGDHFDNIVVHT